MTSAPSLRTTPIKAKKTLNKPEAQKGTNEKNDFNHFLEKYYEFTYLKTSD